MEDVLSHRLAVDKVVKRREFLQFKGGHPEESGSFFKGLVTEVTIMLLKLEHDVDRHLARMFCMSYLGL
jgi:hypothetical protein